jgi:hypothetical protein
MQNLSTGGITLAYSGYLLKFGNTALPFKYIYPGTYKVSPSQTADLDSYRDANAVLHRNVVRNNIAKIEWETPYLTDTEVLTLMNIINAGMTNAMERKVTVTFYQDDQGTYRTGNFYVPDITFTVYQANAHVVIYMPTRIALIEY